MTIDTNVLGVLTMLQLMLIALAAMAGTSWGAARTYERLRPERNAQEMQAEALRIIEQMRTVYEEAITELLVRRVREPRSDLVPLEPNRRRRHQPNLREHQL